MPITRNQSKLINNFQHIEISDNRVIRKNKTKLVYPKPNNEPVKYTTVSVTEEDIRLNDLRWDLLVGVNRAVGMDKRNEAIKKLENFDNKHFPYNRRTNRIIA